MPDWAYLAINALAATDPYDSTNITRRRLEIVWYGTLDEQIDKVALFDKEPNLVEDTPVLLLDPSNFVDDFYVTNIQLENLTNAEIG